MKINYMRLFTLFILLVSVGVFTSCSTDKEDAEDAAFVGTWKLVKASFGAENAAPQDFADFAIVLNSDKTYKVTNTLNFTSPINAAGIFTANGSFLAFDSGKTVRTRFSNGNTMVWEWEVAIPGKVTTTYRYTFERI